MKTYYTIYNVYIYILYLYTGCTEDLAIPCTHMKELRHYSVAKHHLQGFQDVL
jgi:hypothetical protein